MNHEDDLTLPQPDPTPGASPQPSTTPIASPSWFARYRIAVVSAAGAVVVGAVAVAAVLLLSQPNPTIEKMVPAVGLGLRVRTSSQLFLRFQTAYGFGEGWQFSLSATTDPL